MVCRTIVTASLALLVAGCASSGGVGSSSQQFDVSLAQANAAVQSLYPSHLEWAQSTEANGGEVRIRRDELTQDGQVVVVVEEKNQSPAKTRIVLTSIAPQRTEISVQASRSKKTVLLPDRDSALEAAKLNAIAERLGAPATRNSP